VDVNTIFEQVCCKAVPQGMHTYLFGDIGFWQCFADDVLDGSFPHWLARRVTFKEPCLRLAGI
jgi:hypothetical protein